MRYQNLNISTAEAAAIETDLMIYANKKTSCVCVCVYRAFSKQ